MKLTLMNIPVQATVLDLHKSNVACTVIISAGLDTEAAAQPGKAATPSQAQGHMYCKICTNYSKTGSFVTGTSVFKVENVKAHGSSKDHMKRARKEAAEKQQPGTSETEWALQKLNEADFKRLSLLCTSH